MTVGTPSTQDFQSQSGTVYKTAIDNNSLVAKALTGQFAPHQETSPAMTVRLDAGFLVSGTTRTTVNAQSTGTITAPVGNPRIDLVVIDKTTGAVSVITGTPAGSPTAPALTSGKIPICEVTIQTSSTVITNAMIVDARPLVLVGGVADGTYGDIVISSNGTVYTVGSNAITTSKITDNNVTLAKLATQAANTILANTTGSTAVPTAVAISTNEILLRQSSNLTSLAIAASRIVARLASGDVKACTTTEINTLLGNLTIKRALFDGATGADVSGTYSRTGTTVTVSVTAHGHLVNHWVYCDFTTGAAVDGWFQVATVPDANTFTVTHGTSGSTSGNITLPRRAITESSGIANISYETTGLTAANFLVAFPTANYTLAGATVIQIATSAATTGRLKSVAPNAISCRLNTYQTGAGSFNEQYSDITFIG